MRITALLLLTLFSSVAYAQSIKGVVIDVSGVPVSEVAVQNIYTEEKALTPADGSFTMSVKTGQLIEFRKIGYKTARVRINAGALPPFYRIILEQGVQELPEVQVQGRFKDFRHDSIYYHELFKKQINYPVLTGWRAFQSPFSAMSKTNREMMRFQKEFAWLEQEKYVDYAFNEKLIAQLTGLKGDSAQQYMRRYRPSYEMLRSMPEYDFFTYVKQTVHAWRERQRMGPGTGRSSG